MSGRKLKDLLFVSSKTVMLKCHRHSCVLYTVLGLSALSFCAFRMVEGALSFSWQ